MQYLAKVQKNAFLGGAELALLALRTSEATWERLPAERRVGITGLGAFAEGHLVLVELVEIQELERHLKQEREELEQRWEALNHHARDLGHGSPDSG